MLCVYVCLSLSLFKWQRKSVEEFDSVVHIHDMKTHSLMYFK